MFYEKGMLVAEHADAQCDKNAKAWAEHVILRLGPPDFVYVSGGGDIVTLRVGTMPFHTNVMCSENFILIEPKQGPCSCAVKGHMAKDLWLKTIEDLMRSLGR